MQQTSNSSTKRLLADDDADVDNQIQYTEQINESSSTSSSLLEQQETIPQQKQLNNNNTFGVSCASTVKELCTLEYAAKFFLLVCFMFCFSIDISLYSSFALSTAAMLGDKIYMGTGFTKATIGTINSVANACGFMGKLVMPFFVDYFGGVGMSLSVALIMSIGIFMMGYTSYALVVMGAPSINGGVIVHAVFGSMYAASRFIDAASWTSLTVIIRTWFPSFTWGTMYVKK